MVGLLIFTQTLSAPEQGKVSCSPLPRTPGEPSLNKLDGILWWPSWDCSPL